MVHPVQPCAGTSEAVTPSWLLPHTVSGPCTFDFGPTHWHLAVGIGASSVVVLGRPRFLFCRPYGTILFIFWCIRNTSLEPEVAICGERHLPVLQRRS